MKMKKAFTLIEVNLAMLIMAGGILSVVGLYALGFRENRQGREDVSAAAFADAVMSPLVMAMSSTNITWSSFQREFSFPSGGKGWGEYFDGNGVVSSDPKGKASSVYSQVKSWLGYSGEMPSYNGAENDSKMTYGVVVTHPKDSATATIAFRAVPENSFGQLLAMPMFFTEVRFQGRVE